MFKQWFRRHLWCVSVFLIDAGLIFVLVGSIPHYGWDIRYGLASVVIGLVLIFLDKLTKVDRKTDGSEMTGS